LHSKYFKYIGVESTYSAPAHFGQFANNFVNFSDVSNDQRLEIRIDFLLDVRKNKLASILFPDITLSSHPSPNVKCHPLTRLDRLIFHHRLGGRSHPVLNFGANPKRAIAIGNRNEYGFCPLIDPLDPHRNARFDCDATYPDFVRKHLARINTSAPRRQNYCRHSLNEFTTKVCQCLLKQPLAESAYRDECYRSLLATYRVVGMQGDMNARFTGYHLERPDGSDFWADVHRNNIDLRVAIGSEVHCFGSQKYSSITLADNTLTAPDRYLAYPTTVDLHYTDVNTGAVHYAQPDHSLLFLHSAYTIPPIDVVAALEMSAAMYADVVLHKYQPTNFDLRLLFDDRDRQINDLFQLLLSRQSDMDEVFDISNYALNAGFNSLLLTLNCGNPSVPGVQKEIVYGHHSIAWQCQCGHGQPEQCVLQALSIVFQQLSPPQRQSVGLTPHFLFNDELPYFYFLNFNYNNAVDRTNLLLQYSQDELPIAQLVCQEWYEHFSYSSQDCVFNAQTPWEFFTNYGTVANHALPQYAPAWLGDRQPAHYTSTTRHLHEWTVHIRVVRSLGIVPPNLYPLHAAPFKSIDDVDVVDDYLRRKCLIKSNEPTRREMLVKMACAYIDSTQLKCDADTVRQLVNKHCRSNPYDAMHGVIVAAQDSTMHTAFKVGSAQLTDIDSYARNVVATNITSPSAFKQVRSAIADSNVAHHLSFFTSLLFSYYALFCALIPSRNALVWADWFLSVLKHQFCFVAAIITHQFVFVYLISSLIDYMPTLIISLLFIFVVYRLNLVGLTTTAALLRPALAAFDMSPPTLYTWSDLFLLLALLIVCLYMRRRVRRATVLVTQVGLVRAFYGLHYRGLVPTPQLVRGYERGINFHSPYDIDPSIQMHTHGPHFAFYNPVIVDSRDPHNELITAHNRIFRARPEYSDEVGLQFIDWLRSNLNDIFPVDRIKPMSRLRWVSKFKSQRRLEYDRAYSDFVYYGMPFDPDFYDMLCINDFIKREPLIQSEFKSGRNIGARSADYNLLWGNLTETVAKYFSSYSHDPSNIIAYASGFNRSDIGQLFDSWRDEVSLHGEPVFHKSDFSKYDLTVNEHLLAAEAMIYRHICFTDALHDFVLDEAQYRIFGRMRSLTFDLNRAGPYRMLVSGNVNTSIGNSIRTALMRAFQACRVLNCTYAQLVAHPFKIMTLGDDSLTVTTANVALALDSDATLSDLGMDAKQSVTSLEHATFCSSVFLPTSSGSLLLPLIGRHLAKTFFNIHSIGPKKIRGYARGIVNGFRFDFSDMPIIRVIYAHIHRVTAGVRVWKPSTATWDFHHLPNVWKATDATYDFLCRRYDCTRDDINHLEADLKVALSRITSPVFSLDSPLLRRIFEIDNDFSLDAVDPNLSDLIEANSVHTDIVV
jgi:hypothetical protein